MLKYQERSLLLFNAFTIFNDGVIIFLNGLAMQYIFYHDYRVEPADLQMYKVIIMLPLLLKFAFGVIIDSKILSKKTYNIVANFIVSICLFSIGFRYVDTPQAIVAIMFFSTLFHLFVDGTLQSYTLEQARNVPCGNEDLQSFRVVFLSLSSTIGAAVATYFINIDKPRYCYIFMGCTYGLATI